jgi:hypothetical protein
MDADAVREHLVWLGVDGCRRHLCARDADGRMTSMCFPLPQSLEASLRWAARHDTAGHDVYVSQAPRAQADDGKWRRTRRTNGPTQHVWADVDQPDSLERVEAAGLLGLPGLRLVASGTPGRLHVYFSVDVEVAPAFGHELSLRLATMLDGDTGKAGGESLLRLPGTSNWKSPGDPRPVEVLRVNPGSLTLQALDTLLPPAPEPVRKRRPTHGRPKAGSPAASDRTNPAAYFERAAKGEAARLAAAAPGERNSTAASTAWKVGTALGRAGLQHDRFWGRYGRDRLTDAAWANGSMAEEPEVTEATIRAQLRAGLERALGERASGMTA